MNETQLDFISTIKRYYPFLAEYDQLTDALTYALESSSKKEDGEYYSIIDGKVFLSTSEGAFWEGKLLT